MWRPIENVVERYAPGGCVGHNVLSVCDVLDRVGPVLDRQVCLEQAGSGECQYSPIGPFRKGVGLWRISRRHCRLESLVVEPPAGSLKFSALVRVYRSENVAGLILEALDEVSGQREKHRKLRPLS